MDRNRGFDINALRQQLEDLFEDFIPSGAPRRPQGGRPDQAQQVPVNMVDAEDRFLVSLPLPGLLPEDIDITVRGQNLSIKAQRHNPPAERPNYLRREWGYGPFQRSLELPVPVDAEKSSAAFRNGVVTITLPKLEVSRTRTIKVGEEPETAEAEAAAEATATTEATAEAPEGTGISVEESPAAQTEAAEEGALEEVQPPRERGGQGGRRSAFYMPRPQGGRRGQGRQTPEEAKAEPGEEPGTAAKAEPAEVIEKETVQRDTFPEAEEKAIQEAIAAGETPAQEAPEASGEEFEAQAPEPAPDQEAVAEAAKQAEAAPEEGPEAMPAPEPEASAVTPDLEAETAETVESEVIAQQVPIATEETETPAAGEAEAEDVEG